NNIATPGIEIQQAMTKVRAEVNDDTRKQQLPWGHTNLIGAVYLNPTAATTEPSTAGTGPAATGSVDPSVELAFWNSIKDTNSVHKSSPCRRKTRTGGSTVWALAHFASPTARKKKPPPPKTNTTFAATPRSAPDVAPTVDISTAEASAATENNLLLDPI